MKERKTPSQGAGISDKRQGRGIPRRLANVAMLSIAAANLLAPTESAKAGDILQPDRQRPDQEEPLPDFLSDQLDEGKASQYVENLMVRPTIQQLMGVDVAPRNFYIKEDKPGEYQIDVFVGIDEEKAVEMISDIGPSEFYSRVVHPQTVLLFNSPQDVERGMWQNVPDVERRWLGRILDSITYGGPSRGRKYDSFASSLGVEIHVFYANVREEGGYPLHWHVAGKLADIERFWMQNGGQDPQLVREYGAFVESYLQARTGGDYRIANPNNLKKVLDEAAKAYIRKVRADLQAQIESGHEVPQELLLKASVLKDPETGEPLLYASLMDSLERFDSDVRDNINKALEQYGFDWQKAARIGRFDMDNNGNITIDVVFEGVETDDNVTIHLGDGLIMIVDAQQASDIVDDREFDLFIAVGVGGYNNWKEQEGKKYENISDSLHLDNFKGRRW